MRSYINLVQSLMEAAFTPDAFFDRLRAVIELIKRGATEGERAGARAAFERMMERAKIEIARMREEGTDHYAVTNFKNTVDRIAATIKQAHEEPRSRSHEEKPRTRSEPLFKVGQWVFWIRENRAVKITKVVYLTSFSEFDNIYAYEAGTAFIPEKSLRRATQDEIDAATATKAKQSSASGNTDIKIVGMARYVNAAERSNKVYGVVRNGGRSYVFWGGYHKALKTKEYNNLDDANEQYHKKVNQGYTHMSFDEISENKDWVLKALAVEFARKG